MNLFHQMWPSLLKVDGFITSMLTPIVKARRGQGAKEQVLEFFNLPDFERWKDEVYSKDDGSGRGWSIKYYKGLGTSNAKEAKEYFRKMRMVVYRHTGKESDQNLDLAFNKKRADDRKNWLMQYDSAQTLDYGNSDVTFEQFVHKDLVHFSNYDLVRSIPSVMDGLKVSQRKVLFAVLKKNIIKHEVRVASLSGIVQTESAYHHGDASLNGTIIGLAQNFVGANNVNLLLPNGMFGSRVLGGKDHSSPRYIHTQLSPVALKIFNRDDESILKYLDDDGQSIEPEFYLPVIPMVLVNGAMGIGTGFSTNVPCYNPLEVVDLVLEFLDSESLDSSAHSGRLRPWYRGFLGTIDAMDDAGAKFVSRGLYERLSATSVRVTELPIGTWTADFKELLDSLAQESPDVKRYDSKYTDDAVDFVVHFASKESADAWLAPLHHDDAGAGEGRAQCRLEKELKLISNKYLNANNMYLFDSQGRIKKYDSVADMVRDYFPVRLDGYVKRRLQVLATFDRAVLVLSGKVRFLQAVIDGTIQVASMSKARLEETLTESSYDKVDGSYDYLTRLPIYSLTEDKKKELEDELAQTRARRAEYEAKTPRAIWRDDLVQLREELAAFA